MVCTQAFASSGCKLQLKIIAKTNFCTNLVIQKKLHIKKTKGGGTNFFSNFSFRKVVQFRINFFSQQQSRKKSALN